MAMLPPRLQHPANLPLAALLLSGLASLLTPEAAQAGPLVRRAQERRACQEFAGKLQQASGNPAMAQQVYQQGVLALVSRFGENPCTDIPAPVATGIPPATATPAAAPVGAAATNTPTSPAGTSTTAVPAVVPAPSAQQQQACQQFATKLQATSASGDVAAARQTYALGMQKLSGLFGPNPCPAIKPPQ
jgi:hypothetical protein